MLLPRERAMKYMNLETTKLRKANGSAPTLKPLSLRGFTLTEIMIVVAIIGLLAAIAIPNLLRAAQRSQAKACINNLRQIDSAKQQWALENGKAPTSSPVQTDINGFFRTQI